ncbi:hypothetical protein [Maricaulis sp.]|uniref:hypothetical protein n=1 Tax=Maricaulis sp. TaxID=1486257 RepID=UPI002622A1C8|nr:hypothetical protein [Maricaulis sp.]
MIRTIFSACLVAGLAAAAPATAQSDNVRDLHCFAVERGTHALVNLDTYSVIEATAGPGPFHFSADNFDLMGIACRRNTPVPQPNDYKVALSGLALYVDVERGDTPVSTMLHIVDDQFVLRIVNGSLTAAEREQATAQIERYYDRVNAGTEPGPTGR